MKVENVFCSCSVARRAHVRVWVDVVRAPCWVTIKSMFCVVLGLYCSQRSTTFVLDKRWCELKKCFVIKEESVRVYCAHKQTVTNSAPPLTSEFVLFEGLVIYLPSIRL